MTVRHFLTTQDYSRAEIDALLAQDDTTSGREHALFARAAIPTEAGKAAAWASMWDSEELTNSQLEQAVHGFVRVADAALLAPYVDRYFADVEALWAERSFALAEPIALGAYPRPVASEALATAAHAWLDARPDAAAPLRRLVRENLSRTERALTAQARDRA